QPHSAARLQPQSPQLVYLQFAPFTVHRPFRSLTATPGNSQIHAPPKDDLEAFTPRSFFARRIVAQDKPSFSATASTLCCGMHPAASTCLSHRSASPSVFPYSLFGLLSSTSSGLKFTLSGSHSIAPTFGLADQPMIL